MDGDQKQDSASPQKGSLGSLMGKALMRTCNGCQEEVPATVCSPWGKSAWVEVACKSNYNRQSERCVQNPKLKHWWAHLTPTERVAWYKRNKQNYFPGGRKAFDNAGFVEEEHTEEAGDIDDTLWAFLPPDEWFIRERTMGKLAGEIEEQREQANTSFMEIVMNKRKKSKVINGIPCVGVFKGCEERARIANTRKFSTKRHKTISNSYDHSAAQELQEAAALSRQQWYNESMARAFSGIEPGAGSSDDIRPDLERNMPVPKLDASDLHDAIQSSVVLQGQRDAKTTAQEEQDTHEAEQTHKIAKDSGTVRGPGRPRKGMTEMLSDVAKMKRDRVNQLKDGMGTLQRACEGAIAEAKRQCGEPLPSDLINLSVVLESDVDDARKKIELVITTVEGLELAGITEGVDAAVKLEEVKTKCIDESKPAFSIHMVKANKAISSFRSATKKQAYSGKKRKTDETKMSPMVVLAKALVSSQVFDACGVKLFDTISAFEKPTLSANMCTAKIAKEDFEKMKAITAHQKWIQSHVEKTEGLTFAMASYKPATAKAVEAVVKRRASPIHSADVPLPSEYAALRDELFAPQHWAMDEFHMGAGLGPYGLPEVRLLVSGSYIMFGVRFDHIKPVQNQDSIKAKIEHVQTDKGFKQFLEDAKDEAKGFWFVHDAEYTAVCIPPGFVLFSCGQCSSAKGARGAHGMRWSLLDLAKPDDIRAADKHVTTILSTYPELKNDEYLSWQMCLNKYLVPAIDIAAAAPMAVAPS